MSTKFEDFEKQTQEGILTLEQVLNAVSDLFAKNNVIGVVIGYAYGGAGGSGTCLSADFSRINVGRDGNVYLGPFNKEDANPELRVMEENINAISSIHNMLEEQTTFFRNANDGVKKMMDHLGIKTELEKSGAVEDIPSEEAPTFMYPAWTTPEFEKEWYEWEEYSRRFMTDGNYHKFSVRQRILNQLAAMADNAEHAIRIIRYSMAKGWRSLQQLPKEQL